MKIVEDKFENIIVHDELSIALGTFDGVHRGHQKIIERAVYEGKKKGIKSAVFTFNKHPLMVLRPGTEVKILTDNNTKANIIEGLGVDYLFFTDFNEDFAGTDAEEFLFLLKRKLRARVLVCGYNYTFGKYGKGDVKLLEKYQEKLGYELNVIDKVSFEERNISSSIIREKIESGELSEANILLGHNYFYIGRVIEGNKLGRKLGFPTANVPISNNLCIKNGVYITWTYVDGIAYSSISNVGNKPTVGKNERLIEVHIFNFEGNLYNKKIKIEFVEFLREERKFESIDELKDRVLMDINTAREYFNKNNVYKQR
ncbi:bifunctional riboflavin kinase/FAD synthetase [Fonticella tunisiensis]|uniref:Riboflavin biosynthesis protein n=1 Tax=Fonticella tunisiensis TaxID=1096341 RepID=A0A4R7KQU5_9CLOT|nr:bifunctional riboflavin kinase/FAD synthetase [Fonticella tunisiensis]TDT61562.1 FMN adenylyltransferase /riboflavin kinase [Fonticella tunisiensis]